MLRFLTARRPLAGFTLIELLIVVIIVGILVAIGVPAYLSYQAKAKDTDAKNALIVAYKAAIAGRAADNARFPAPASVVSDIAADEPAASVAAGSCYGAVGNAPVKQVLVDPASTSAQLTLCTRSASNTIWRLSGPLTGTPTISDGSGVSFTLVGSTITDAVRVAGVQGDGLPADSSTGIWEQTTNLAINGGFETNLASWNGGTRDSSQHRFGAYSDQIVSGSETWGGGSASAPGQTSLIPFPASTTYTASAWVLIPAGGTTSFVSVYEYDAGGSMLTAHTTMITATGSWQRVSASFTSQATAAFLRFRIFNNSAGTLWVDGVQLEQKSLATPYVETNGVSASRPVSSLQAPGTLLTVAQGWIATRVRLGENFPDPHTAYWGGFFDWGENNTDSIEVYLSPGSSFVNMRRIAGGVAAGSTKTTGNLTKSAGSFITVVAAWTPTQIGIAADGGPFSWQANTANPTIPTGYFDIGRRLATEALDGDVLWFATGTGTLTDADSATINGFGNTDPARGSFPTTAQTTMVWDGTSSTGSLK